MPGWKHARSAGNSMTSSPDSSPMFGRPSGGTRRFYGAPGQGWFLSFHVFTKFVKVTFFDGLELDPIPPGGTPKSGQRAWLDINEDEPLNTPQFTRWINTGHPAPRLVRPLNQATDSGPGWNEAWGLHVMRGRLNSPLPVS